MEEECDVGCLARAQVKGRRAVIGPIIGTSHNGTCWVLMTGKGEQAFHKSHCRRLRSNESGKRARVYRQAQKAKLSAEARAVLGLQRSSGKVYGDGEIE